MKYLLLTIIVIFTSCNTKTSKEVEPITAESVSKTLNSNLTLDEKYHRIFDGNSIYDSELTEKQITDVGKHFYEPVPTLIVNMPRAYVIVGADKKLYLSCAGSAKLLFNKNFEKYWLKVSSSVDFGNSSYSSDTMIFPLTNFDENGVRFSVSSPIDNRLLATLGKEDYIHLDERYLAHKPVKTSFKIILTASNIVGEVYSIPLLFSNFDDSWISPAAEKNSENSSSNENDNSQPFDDSRKLRYLYCSNGGIIGYFNDGTISTCLRCDCARENVERLRFKESTGSYVVENDGTLITDHGTKILPENNEEYSEWKLIDYVWQSDLDN